jgi:DNA-binding transcriptional MerR regulator
MLRIGEFSRLAQVSIKTLHHYDSLGLLHPAEIDPSSGYRFYTVEQLSRIHRIMALKDMGLSLEQIALVLDQELPVEELRGMFRLKQAEIKQHLDEEKRRLAMVEFRLRMIEAEINFPELDVVMKSIPSMRVLTMIVEDHHEMAPVVQEVQDAIRSGDIKYAGFSIDLLRGSEEGHEIKLPEAQHEIILVVEEDQAESVELKSQGTLRLREEPAIDKAATLILEGLEHDERHEQVSLLQRWAVRHEYGLGEQLRVLHHRGPLETLDRSEWVSELQLAVELSE